MLRESRAWICGTQLGAKSRPFVLIKTDTQYTAKLEVDEIYRGSLAMPSRQCRNAKEPGTFDGASSQIILHGAGARQVHHNVQFPVGALLNELLP